MEESGKEAAWAMATTGSELYKFRWESNKVNNTEHPSEQPLLSGEPGAGACLGDTWMDPLTDDDNVDCRCLAWWWFVRVAAESCLWGD